MTKTLIVLTVLFGSLSLASPANAEQATDRDPITTLGWVNTKKTFKTQSDCNTYGAGGVALGQWDAYDCKYWWFYFPNRWELWVRVG